MSCPRVSVILPVYNRAGTLPDCIESVLAQTYPDWELLAIDDASTDNSVAVIEAFKDARIKVLRQNVNGGPSVARNAGIRSARGEYIALLDSDDTWLQGKLAAQLPLLDGGECDLCGCEYWKITEAGETTRVTLPEPVSWSEYLETACDLANGSTLVARRRVVEEVGLMDENLRLYEDWDWMIRLVENHTYRVVHEPLARIHVPASRSAAAVASAAEIFLSRHKERFERKGRTRYGRILGKLFENIAANAFTHRHFALGVTNLLKSFAANPCQNPLRLSALFLAPIDAVLGTSLIQRGAAMQRKLFTGR